MKIFNICVSVLVASGFLSVALGIVGLAVGGYALGFVFGLAGAVLGAVAGLIFGIRTFQ